MSYDYFDASARGYLAPGPSATGQWALREYLLSHGGARFPRILDYLEHGYTDFPRQLAADLSRIPLPESEPLAGRLKDLIRAARRADAVLILSDGVG